MNSGEQLQDGAYRLLSSFKSRVHRLFFDKSSAFENLPFAREAKPKEKKKKKQNHLRCPSPHNLSIPVNHASASALDKWRRS
jgi:hypothetical protein